MSLGNCLIMQATESQIKYLTNLIRDWDEASRMRLFRALNVKVFEELTKEQASAVIDFIKIGALKANTEVARECMKAGLKVAEELPSDVGADKKAEIAGRWGITFYLDRTR